MHYLIFMSFIFSLLLMVLTINSRGCLCPSHPPVIMSADLIVLFSFSSLQSGAGKARLQDGDVIVDHQASTTQ